MGNAEEVLTGFEMSALREVDWTLGIGHRPAQMFTHEKVRVAVVIEVKAAGVPGVSFMRYIQAHYRVNDMNAKRTAVLQAIEGGKAPAGAAQRVPPRTRRDARTLAPLQADGQDPGPRR